MEDDQRPDAAWKILEHIAGSAVYDSNEGARLRLRMIGVATRAGNYDLAVAESRALEEAFKDSPWAHEAAYRRLVCWSKQEKPKGVLAEADALLKKPSLAEHRASLLYLKWWALVKTGEADEAEVAATALLDEFSEEQVAAPVAFWKGTQALARGEYETARSIFTKIETRFPSTAYAEKAQEMTARLSRLTK